MTTIVSYIQLDPDRVLPHAAAYVAECTENNTDLITNEKYMKALSLKRSMSKGTVNYVDPGALVDLVKMGLYV